MRLWGLLFYNKSIKGVFMEETIVEVGLLLEEEPEVYEKILDEVGSYTLKFSKRIETE